MDPVPRLAEVLNRHYWLRREEPFPHAVARDVFKPDTYRALETAFEDLLALGFAEQQNEARFARSMRGYDAYGLTFGPEVTGPFRLFISREWHSLIEGLTGVEATGHINCGLHHHRPGSANGRVHNDLNPGWFVNVAGEDGIHTTRNDLINYTSGETFRPGVDALELIRAVAVIFYLNNPPWSRGDGGETALYHALSDPIECPAATVAPVNNSLVVFECTPFSYHTFLSNRKHARNSVIMWLHRPKEVVVGRWGCESIVHWKR
jgi:hypothetical protein